MKVFRIDVKMYATAYIKAEDEAAAKKIVATSLTDEGIEFSSKDQWVSGEIAISGQQYDSEDLPDISLSPAMTIVGAEDIGTIECVHDDDDEDEEEESDAARICDMEG